MYPTALPRVKDDIDVRSNAQLAMCVTLLGIRSAPDKLVHIWKAPCPIYVTVELSNKVVIPDCWNA